MSYSNKQDINKTRWLLVTWHSLLYTSMCLCFANLCIDSKVYILMKGFLKTNLMKLWDYFNWLHLVHFWMQNWRNERTKYCMLKTFLFINQKALSYNLIFFIKYFMANYIYSKTPIYRRFWGKAKTRGKSGSAVNWAFGFWGLKLAKNGGKGL